MLNQSKRQLKTHHHTSSSSLKRKKHVASVSILKTIEAEEVKQNTQSAGDLFASFNTSTAKIETLPNFNGLGPSQSQAVLGTLSRNSFGSSVQRMTTMKAFNDAVRCRNMNT